MANGKTKEDVAAENALVEEMISAHFRAAPGQLVKEKAILAAYEVLKDALTARNGEARRFAQFAVSALVMKFPCSKGKVSRGNGGAKKK